MSRIVVKVSVEIEGPGITGNGRLPSELAFQYEVKPGDNPNWYGDAVQRAIQIGARRAITGVRPHVVLGGVPDAGD